MVTTVIQLSKIFTFKILIIIMYCGILNTLIMLTLQIVSIMDFQRIACNVMFAFYRLVILLLIHY